MSLSKCIRSKLTFLYHGRLIDLKAFDPTVDCPVEILHTTTLGTCKYLTEALCANLLPPEKYQVESSLKSINSRAYRRNVNSSLRNVRSFVDRDFKLFCQHIALILMGIVYQRGTTDSRKELLNKFVECFQRQGEFLLLIYTSKITENYDA